MLMCDVVTDTSARIHTHKCHAGENPKMFSIFFSFLWYVNFPEESRFKLQQFTRTLNNSELNLTYVKVYVCANGDTAQ